MIRDFRDLIVWQKAMELACIVPPIVERLPASERFSLGDQIRRAVISVPSNIAEGHGRRSRGEFRRFVTVANGSLKEVQTILLLIERRELLSSQSLEEALELVSQIGRMLTALYRKLSS